MKQQIILASSSPRRKELLKKIIPKFKIVPSDYEEDMTKKLSPIEMALEFSRGKAEDVALKQKSGIVIGVDTFVVYKNKKLGKPHTKEKATEMLKIISGKTVKVISGICVINIDKKRIIQDIVVTSVKMKKMDQKEISEYVESGEPLDKAGAFAIQDKGSVFVEKIDGCYFNVMGFPLNKLYVCLKKIGYNVFQ
jgi:septum formation protein